MPFQPKNIHVQGLPGRRLLFRTGILYTIFLLGLPAFSAMAGAPAQGIVVEGVSVPGIELGFARLKIEAAYGEPDACQDVEINGDLAFCRFPVEGGGTVNVWFQGADGRYASNSPDDIVFQIGWSAGGWTTTAGINKELALNDREAVVAAYPNAEVTYDERGKITKVEDLQLGIVIRWIQNFYMFPDSVSMAIFTPPAILPAGSSIHIADIDVSVVKIKGQRHVFASVLILGEQNEPVYEANVTITWAYPRGAEWVTYDVSSNTGYALFELYDARNGTYTLTVEDVLLEGHPFDPDNSALSVSFRVN